MKPLIDTAPEPIRRAFEMWKADTSIPTAGGGVVSTPSVGFERAMAYAFERGFDVPEASLPDAGAPCDSFERYYRERCRALWRARRAWAAEPSFAERQAAAAAERAEREREARIAARATELEALDIRSAAAKRAQKARSQAERELADENPESPRAA